MDKRLVPPARWCQYQAMRLWCSIRMEDVHAYDVTYIQSEIPNVPACIFFLIINTHLFIWLVMTQGIFSNRPLLRDCLAAGCQGHDGILKCLVKKYGKVLRFVFFLLRLNGMEPYSNMCVCVCVCEKCIYYVCCVFVEDKVAII